MFVAQLKTLSSGADCTQGVPFTLSNGSNSITFLKNLSQQPLAQFVVNPTWNVAITNGVPASTNTLVTFANGGPKNVNLCPGPTYDGTGKLIAISDPQNPAKDMDLTTTAVEYACYATRTQTVVTGSPDYLQVTEQIYLEGDVKFTR